MGKLWVSIFGAFAVILVVNCTVVRAGPALVQPGLHGNMCSNAQQNQNSIPSHQSNSNYAGREEHELPTRPQRNRFEEDKGKRSCGARKQKRARKKNIGGSGGRLVDAENPKEPRPDGKDRINRGKVDATTERVDDVPLLLAMMVNMGLQQVLDNHIPTRWTQRDLSWGWTALIWLAYILSEGDHRKVAMRDFVRGMKHTVGEWTGQTIDELDFTDDRLTVLLRYLRNETYWNEIERELSENTIEVFDLEKETIRCDATTVSGYGNSKDDPNRAQIKIMTGSLDPLGMPIATDVVAGNRADDQLYSPVIRRINRMLKKTGLLYVGDCKLGSWENRWDIKVLQGHYLCPLPHTGETAKKLPGWIDQGVARDERDELAVFAVKNAKGEEEVKAKGYEIVREHAATTDETEIRWEERVLICNSPKHAQIQENGLERRIRTAQEKILALTPERGRGRRQITEESDLLAAIEGILKKHKVEGLVTYEYIREVEREEKYIGRGRGSSNREKRVLERIRYVITNVDVDRKRVNAVVKRFGWKVFVTDVPVQTLSFVEAMKCYRKEYRVERIFHRLKSRLEISPLFVKRDDQAIGMSRLLTLGVRVLTLIEYVVRRSLEKSSERLVGLHAENPKKATDTPTSERILKAFSGINLTIMDTGREIIRHVSPLSKLQVDILSRLGLDSSIYDRLEIGQSPRPLSE
jgi:transposase